MPRVETRYEHIVLEDSVPMISGTTLKLVDLLEQILASGWSPEKVRCRLPFLSMGQIHSALAYYWDHKEELDPLIKPGPRRDDAPRISALPAFLALQGSFKVGPGDPVEDVRKARELIGRRDL